MYLLLQVRNKQASLTREQASTSKLLSGYFEHYLSGTTTDGSDNGSGSQNELMKQKHAVGVRVTTVEVPREYYLVIGNYLNYVKDSRPLPITTVDKLTSCLKLGFYLSDSRYLQHLVNDVILTDKKSSLLEAVRQLVATAELQQLLLYLPYSYLVDKLEVDHYQLQAWLDIKLSLLLSSTLLSSTLMTTTAATAASNSCRLELLTDNSNNQIVAVTEDEANQPKYKLYLVRDKKSTEAKVGNQNQNQRYLLTHEITIQADGRHDQRSWYKDGQLSVVRSSYDPDILAWSEEAGMSRAYYDTIVLDGLYKKWDNPALIYYANGQNADNRLLQLGHYKVGVRVGHWQIYDLWHTSSLAGMIDKDLVDQLVQRDKQDKLDISPDGKYLHVTFDRYYDDDGEKHGCWTIKSDKGLVLKSANFNHGLYTDQTGQELDSRALFIGFW